MTPAMTLEELKSRYDTLTGEDCPAWKESTFDDLIEEFLPEARRICARGPRRSEAESEYLAVCGKVVAAALIYLFGTHSFQSLREKMLLFLEIASAAVPMRSDFLDRAVESIGYKVSALDLRLEDIKASRSLDALCFLLIAGLRFDKLHPDTFQYTGKGKASCVDGVFQICSAETGDAGVEAFSLAGDRIRIVTPNVRSEKLRQSDTNDADALMDFAESFLQAQDRFRPARTQGREFHDGDRVNIRITDQSEDGQRLLCELLGSEDSIQGPILEEELIKGVWTSDIMDYLYSQDCIRGAVFCQDDGGEVSFSIREAYRQYAVAEATSDRRTDVVFDARVIRIFGRDDRCNWITPGGYGGISLQPAGRRLQVGDVAVMRVANVKQPLGAAYINLEPAGEFDTAIRHFGSDEDILGRFIVGEDDVRLTGHSADTQGDTAGAAGCIRSLVSILATCVRDRSSMDLCRQAALRVFLSRLINDGALTAAALADFNYLSRCVSFAQWGQVRRGRPEMPSEERASVMALLSFWEHPGDELPRLAEKLSAGSEVADIASLLLGLGISSRFSDEVKAEREVVRRKICEILGVADQFRKAEEIRSGKYGRGESHEVEFKSSYVFRNDGGGASIHYQGRGEVFGAVCGFLNADGGTLYLGVRDSGDPITRADYGLNADMKWLGEHYPEINADRRKRLGHPVNRVSTLDQFVQFLDAEKELYFKESLQSNIIIEVTPDQDAIRISVAPAEFEIAYLYSDKTRSDGIAFVRDGGRTVPMTSVQKRQRLASLKKITKEMGFVVEIQEAIDKKRKLYFKDYSSGNSGEVKDRHVVPMFLFYNDENVYCYDLDAADYRQFRLHRIGSIVPDPDEAPYSLAAVDLLKADVFRWLESEKEPPRHVKLRMTARARNYLMEEYSMAERLPADEFYEAGVDDSGHALWILDTHVNGLGAVLRFYLGLADQIEILPTEDSEELKAEIRSYIEKNMIDPR